MKHNAKRGFTIVELVVVIAVIAVLAAVLIPTFSSLIKKANLSADKQAVREMNMALAADQVLNNKPSDIEAVMRVLANAGYNSQNWICLTQGYEVYWWAEQNRCVLYNAATAEIEYPVEYVGTNAMVTAENGFFLYNQNNYNAVTMDFSLSSASSVSASADNLVSAVSNASDKPLSASASAALTKISSLLGTSDDSNSALKSAIGLDATSATSAANLEFTTREITSSATTSAAYASMQISSIGTKQTLTSSGEPSPNFYYISTTFASNATAAEKSAAAKAAGEYVYTVFTKINAGQIVNDRQNSVAIVLDSGSTFDLSAHEWAPAKTFTGYFGASDPENPVIINGAKLSAATGYASTVSFTGSNSSYFVTGFFGTIYGDTTIENVVFKNITFTEPAMDYQAFSAKNQNNRNTIGIIGGITDGGDGIPCNVVLKNITVDSSVKFIAGAQAGGLIGYIGGAGTNNRVTGNVSIENCHVSAELVSNYIAPNSDYGPMGGLIGLVCRVGKELSKDHMADPELGTGRQDWTYINIVNTTFDGTINGHQMIGAAIGDMIANGAKVHISNSHFENATLNSKGYTNNDRVAGVVHAQKGDTTTYYLGTGTAASDKRTRLSNITIDDNVQYNSSFGATSVK